VDCELDRGKSPAVVSALIENLFILLQGYGGHDYPIDYTSQGWWDPHVLPASFWKKYPLHVANYTTAAVPLIPRDWTDWAIWQWSAGGNRRGPEFGATSPDIDLNRMRPEFWDKYIEAPTPPPYELPGELDVIVNVDNVKYEGTVWR